jgi:hypothetical protein
VQDRFEQLEELARAAFDAAISVEEWLGNAGTRQAATDALRRLEVKLMATGFEPPIGKNLDFRGSILDDLERMGLRYDCRDDALHFFVPGEARCYASGPRLADFLASFRDSPQTGFGSLAPSCVVGGSGRQTGGEP